MSIALAYAIWILTCVGAAVDVWIWRSDVLGLMLRAHLDQYIYRLLDEVSVYVLVLGWLIFVIWTEGFYRVAAERGILSARARRGFAWVVGILGVGWLVYHFVL